MFSIILLCFCVVLIGYLLSLKLKTKTKGCSIGNKLPGPTPLPIIGNLVQIGLQPHVNLTKWAKRYGDIYGIKLGLRDAIVVNDYKLIKELFSETVSTGKMGDIVMLEFTKGPYGILNLFGSAWENERKFTVRTLRSLGFAKSSMEVMILDEVQVMLKWIRNQENCLISGEHIFNAPVVNSLWRIISGERCNWEETRPAILDAMDRFLKEFKNVTSKGLLFAPYLRFIARNLLGWNRYVKSINTLMNIFQNSINEHRKNLSSTESRDYIDLHLLEIKSTTDPKSSFYNEAGNANLMARLFELFLAGYETIAVTLSWALLYLSENQKIQKSLQKEINKVVGLNLPSLSDRPNMPYIEAVISEILRITSIGPIGIPHTMISDFVFHGYYLPAGATVIANLYAVHHDPKIWGDPESFRPERFLDEDKTNFVQNEALIPFSEGKRKCIGDTLAKDTLFLFLTSICQQFDILPDPDEKEQGQLEPQDFGIMLLPKPFKVVLKSRKC